jgi:hypothetical protein
MKINTIEHKNGENFLKLKKSAMLGTRIGRDNSKTWEIEVFEENMRRDHEEPYPKKIKIS